MKKNLVFCVAGLMAFAMIGCISTPSFTSLPEASQIAASFVGSWVSNDAIVSKSYGSLESVRGRQFYTFYNDGTGEVMDYNGTLLTNRRAFKYRVSDTLIGFQFLQGTVYTNGGSFSRPYILSPDNRKITFPFQKLLLGAFFAELTLLNATPPPLPPPPPRPNNPGQIYYSYNGIGHVYEDNSVFYLCSNGKPVGYLEGGVIYAFGGKALGFVDRSWIYNLKGDPIGAIDPKSLGLDAEGKKPVTKADKQGLPAKQAGTPVNKPRLRNGYFGGVLSDIFS
ncbi:MAG: hypothetical protein LBQ88_04075 [Treponema sp.]|jgi:hypothetical protein|nr:hypothetical protein [Treponema sp.]